MKILIPTDFSRLSRIAMDYVLEWSKDVALDMVILHVVDDHGPAMARLSSSKLQEVILLNAQKDMEELMQSIRNKSSHELTLSSAIVSDASIKAGVETYAVNHDVDLICIGTKGATGIKKLLFGSNAAGIISSSSVPVLTIPEDAKYKGVDNLVYSCDLENIEKELELLIPLAETMNAWIHILHINTEPEAFDYDLERQKNRLEALYSFENLTSKVLENDSIIDGINEYLEGVDADMLVMFTRSSALFDKLFKPSITKKAAFQTKTPLLTIQKK